MNIAFVGEVDHGKSSLIGRLLIDTKSLPLDKSKEFAAIAKELGGEACLAFLLDQFMEEREGLLTIDTTEIVLKIKNKHFTCIDTPGHLKFLKNMMTGASHADAAVIVIDSLCGIQEQTLLHTHILEMFGIKSVIFVVNKMDLVNYQERPFRLIENAICALSGKSKITATAIVPVSARYGINILRNSDKTKWYKGKPLLWSIEHLKGPLAKTKQTLRLPIQDIYQIDGNPIIVGRLSQGTIRKNQKALICPSMEETQINAIKIFDQQRTSAHNGENVGICCSPSANIKRGDVLCDLEDPLQGVRQFQTQVLWLAEHPPHEKESVVIQIATQQIECSVKSIEQSIHTSTFNITLNAACPAAVEPFTKNNELGRFMIEKKGQQVAAGIITRILNILIFCIPLLWITASFSLAFAQNTDDKDLKNLQSLSYLQGYSPPTRLKNVTLYNRQKSFYGYNLFISSYAPEATLMDMNGTTIHKWSYSNVNLPFDHKHSDDYWAHVKVLKNGDLLALIPYGGILKIDKNSHLIWFKSIFAHHDFDVDSSGNIYTLTIKDLKINDIPGLKIDSITILSPNGKIKQEISLYDLFKKYSDLSYIKKIIGLGHAKSFFYTNNGSKILFSIPGDTLHSNSIQVLDGKWVSKNPAFKKGNLLISVRNLGIIICVDPKQEKIVWLMDKSFWNEGQHFAKLLDNGDIMLFDNYYIPDLSYSIPLHPKLSRVVEFDPLSDQIIWDYSGQNGRFYSAYLGQSYRLPNGNTLITESTLGYSFEVTPDKKIVWKFYNPHQVNKNIIQPGFNRKRRFPGKYKKLIAVIYQMQRIPIDSDLNWLKN